MKRYALIFLIFLTLLFSTCKKSEEIGPGIIGVWGCDFNGSVFNENEMIMTFKGDVAGGTWTGSFVKICNLRGTYTVIGNAVSIAITDSDCETKMSGGFQGMFESTNQMSGNFEVFSDGNCIANGTWIAVKK